MLPACAMRLGTLLALLTDQTGNVPQLTASPEIGDRVVGIGASGMRVATAMAALAAAGDWRWETTDAGTSLLRLMRREEFPALDRADPTAGVYSRDLRAFLGYVGPKGEAERPSAAAVRARARSGYHGAVEDLRSFCSAKVGAGGTRRWAAWSSPDAWEDALAALTFRLLMGGDASADSAQRIPDLDALGRAWLALREPGLVIVLPAAGEGLAEVGVAR